MFISIKGSLQLNKSERRMQMPRELNAPARLSVVVIDDLDPSGLETILTYIQEN